MKLTEDQHKQVIVLLEAARTVQTLPLNKGARTLLGNLETMLTKLYEAPAEREKRNQELREKARLIEMMEEEPIEIQELDYGFSESSIFD